MASNVDSAGNSHVESIHDEEAAVSVPDTGDSGESGKLKMIVQLVKKCLGVKDIASMCVVVTELPRAADANRVSQATLPPSITPRTRPKLGILGLPR